MNIERIACGKVNCFLLVDGEDAILVDTGTPAFREKVDKECEKVKLSLIVLTHGHIDHTGNAQYLSKKYHVPIGLHKLDFPLVKVQSLDSLHAHTLFGHILLWFTKRFVKDDQQEPFQVDVFLKDNMELLPYGVDAKIVRLSGHTKGSIGVKVGQSDFIVGDSMMNFWKPVITEIYENYDQAKISAQIISQSGKRMIHFGHGKSVWNQYWTS